MGNKNCFRRCLRTVSLCALFTGWPTEPRGAALAEGVAHLSVVRGSPSRYAALLEVYVGLQTRALSPPASFFISDDRIATTDASDEMSFCGILFL